MSHTFETQLGGRTLTIETGKLARLAGGELIEAAVGDEGALDLAEEIAIRGRHQLLRLGDREQGSEPVDAALTGVAAAFGDVVKGQHHRHQGNEDIPADPAQPDQPKRCAEGFHQRIR